MGKSFSGSQNGTKRGLQTRTGFRDCKSGQEGLQIEEGLGISNRSKKVTNRGKRDFKLGQGLQIGAEYSLFFNKAVGLQTFCFRDRLQQTEAATGAVLRKKVFLKILQNSQENTCARVFYLIKMQA